MRPGELRLFLVERPVRGVVAGGDGEVVYDRHPHVGVCLQTKDQDRGTDEEDRNYSHTLQQKTFFNDIPQYKLNQCEQ